MENTQNTNKTQLEKQAREKRYKENETDRQKERTMESNGSYTTDKRSDKNIDKETRRKNFVDIKPTCMILYSNENLRCFMNNSCWCFVQPWLHIWGSSNRKGRVDVGDCSLIHV